MLTFSANTPGCCVVCLYYQQLGECCGTVQGWSGWDWGGLGRTREDGGAACSSFSGRVFLETGWAVQTHRGREIAREIVIAEVQHGYVDVNGFLKKNYPQETESKVTETQHRWFRKASQLWTDKNTGSRKETEIHSQFLSKPDGHS